MEADYVFKSLSLKWKLNIIVIATVLIIMLVVSMIIYDFTSNAVLDQVNEKIDIMTDYQKKMLNVIIHRKKEEMREITLNPVISLYADFAYKRKLEYGTLLETGQEYVNDNNNVTFKELINVSSLARTTGSKLKTIVSEMNYAEIAYITTLDGTVIADSRYSIDKSPSKNIYTDIKLPPSKYKDLSIGVLTNINNQTLFLINYPIFNKEGIVAYCVVGLSPLIFKDSLDSLLKDYGEITLLNKNGYILNHYDKALIGKKIKDQWYLGQIDKGEEQTEKIDNDDYLLLDKINELDMYFAIRIQLKKINEPAVEIRNSILSFSMIGILIIFLIITTAITVQFKPLNHLITKMKEVRKGNMDTQINVKGDDEIGELSHNFNKMIVDIRKLLQKVKDDQEEIRRVEFKALQSQINPHFLYNTLDFICWMTRTKQYKVIEKMVVALSSFFRLALNNGQDITTIKKEIEHVENYILIQKLRYPKKFKCNISVSPELLDNECIKLILQPLVENSLLHGFKDVENGGIIDISIKSIEHKVIFQIYDNGCGTDILKMNKIINDNNKDKSEGFAISSVNNRIKLYYGEEYGLTFLKQIGKGTKVQVVLPLKKSQG